MNRTRCRARRTALSVLFLLATLPASTVAQNGNGAAAPVVVEGEGSANYSLAARWAPYKIDRLIYSTSVNPRWIEGTERFWYQYDTSNGTTYWIVDPARRSKREIFDNERLAAELTRITRDPYDAQHLPIRRIRFLSGNRLQFEVESTRDTVMEEERDEQQDTVQQQQRRGGRPRTQKKVHHFEYDIDTRTLRELEDYEAPDNHPNWASVSPDGNTIVFARDHNLYMMTGADYARILDARRGKSGAEADSAEKKVQVPEVQLTQDGVEHYSWAVRDFGDTDQEKEKNKAERKRAAVSWSKDSRRVAMVRMDQREVGDLWVIHSVGNDRPELETYKYDMPGEEHVTQNELWVYDLVDRRPLKIDTDGWKDASLDIANDRQFFYPDSEEPRQPLWLSDDSENLHFVRMSRDRHRVDVMVANASTGEARPIIEERLNTYLEVREPELLSNGDILWWSERDGWAHIYRFGPDGTLKNQLTSGSYSVRSIDGVDERNGLVFFHAAGRERGEDPYYQHLYSVRLDGSGLRLLNGGDQDHRGSLNESNRWFVDNYSRVNTAPTSVLRDARTGEVVAELETADFGKLEEAGWAMPEPFTVKAGDGVTDLYGVMYKPFDFDPNKRYPIIAYVYPGPQTESVAKSFSTSRFETALAQFGFIVITVGNRGGNPSRSKWYHNYGYGNLRDYGLEDKKVAIEQLADRHGFIDISRVGIYGHSGGGFMSTAAMLVYPDFFKVAVSSSGNHQNDVYNRWWSETHHGVKEVVDDSGNVTFEYDIDKNSDLAANLKGHLLLTTGDIDNNVHHANTLRMAEALIRANKRFDYFVFPGQRHGYGNMSDYWFWLRAEYFVRHLLGDHRWNADIVELQVERPRSR